MNQTGKSTEERKEFLQKYFDLLRPWLMSVHINNIWNPEYPYREFFSLLKNDTAEDRQFRGVTKNNAGEDHHFRGVRNRQNQNFSTYY